MSGRIAQDSEPVIIRKKAPTAAARKDEKAVNAARRAGAEIATVRRATAGSNKASSSRTPLNNRKLYKTENLTGSDDKVPIELKIAIVQGRTDKKLTQAQLARMINEEPQIIREYESGIAIPNQQMITKLESALGVKLRATAGSNKDSSSRTPINPRKLATAGSNKDSSSKTPLNPRKLATADSNKDSSSRTPRKLGKEILPEMKSDHIEMFESDTLGQFYTCRRSRGVIISDSGSSSSADYYFPSPEEYQEVASCVRERIVTRSEAKKAISGASSVSPASESDVILRWRRNANGVWRFVQGLGDLTSEEQKTVADFAAILAKYDLRATDLL